MNPDQLCMGCMEERGAASVCPHCGFDESSPPASVLYLAPRTLLHGQYLIGRVLGHGGFGITYLAWDQNLARKLAVKEYLPGGVASRASGNPSVVPYSGHLKQDFEFGLEKFLEEGRVLARFQNHPGIVAVLNFFRENGTAYLVMEYLDGVTLDQFLTRKGGAIPYETALRIMMPVMDALREVHKAGILHRDISPDNVYICAAGPVKVLDFGAARYAFSQHSRNLSIILKEGYAPEEQYRTKGNQSTWTDVYAVAATMYRAITGKTPQAALDRMHTDELEPPSKLGVEISPIAETALLRALAVHMSDRFATMEDFQAALGWQAGERTLPTLAITEMRQEAAVAGGGSVAPRTPSHASEQMATRALTGTPTPVPAPAATPKWVFALSGAAVLAVVVGVAVKSAYRPVAPAQTSNASIPTPTPPSINPTAAAETQPAPQSAPVSPAAKQSQSNRPSGARTPAPGISGVENGAANRNVNPVENPGPFGAPVRSPQFAQSGTNQEPTQTEPNAVPRQNSDYSGLIHQAQASADRGDLGNAMRLAAQALALDRNKPEPYSVVAFASLYRLDDVETARQNYEEAVQLGGSGKFVVVHDHDGQFADTCRGPLIISRSSVEFRPTNAAHTFKVSRNEVREAKMNKGISKFIGSQIGRLKRGSREPADNSPSDTFHIRTVDGNYNFVGTSRTKRAEADMILGLLRGR